MLLVNKRAQIGPLLGIGGVNGIFGLPLVVDDEAARVKSARVEPVEIVPVHSLAGASERAAGNVGACELLDPSACHRTVPELRRDLLLSGAGDTACVVVLRILLAYVVLILRAEADDEGRGPFAVNLGVTVLIGGEPNSAVAVEIEALEVVFALFGYKADTELTLQPLGAECVAEHRRNHENRPAVASEHRSEAVILFVEERETGGESVLKLISAQSVAVGGASAEIQNTVNLALALYGDAVFEAKRIADERVDLFFPEIALRRPSEGDGVTVLLHRLENGKAGVRIVRGLIIFVESIDAGRNVEFGDRASVENDARAASVDLERVFRALVSVHNFPLSVRAEEGAPSSGTRAASARC